MKKYFVQPQCRIQGSTECAALDIGIRYSYPGLVLCFPYRLDEARLREALSRVLCDFPPYAGKLVLHGVRLTIQHGRGAALFEVVRSPKPLRSLLDEVQAGQGHVYAPSLSKLAILRGTEVPLAARLTSTVDGCVLAVAWNHAVGDMHSTMLLMRAWVTAYAGGAYEQPVLVADRDAYLRSALPNPKAARSAATRVGWLTAAQHMHALMRPSHQRSLELSWSQLHGLREALSSERRVSINDALCAHVYTALRHLGGAAEPTNLCLVVNYRDRLGLPHHLVGNMTSLLSLPVDETDSAAEVARNIREGLEQYPARHMNYHATMRVVDATQHLGARMRIVSRQFAPGSGDILITNWNHFGLYDLRFENDEEPLLAVPVALGTTSLAQWVMIIYELPRSSGLGLTVGLPDDVARRWSSSEGRARLQISEPVRDAATAPVLRQASA